MKMEELALSRESDAASKERLGKLRADLADRQEQLTGLTARWEQEKSGLNRVGELKKKLDDLKGQAERAQRDGDYETASRLLYGEIPTLDAEIAIVAVGIAGNVEELGLEALGVTVDRSHVVIDAHAATNVKGLYAIGDVAGAPWLAHKASHEGIIAVETIAGMKTHAMDVTNIPGCTYCTPQVASVGLTEQAAKYQKLDIRVGRFPFVGNGKAIALGEADGLVKTVFDAETGELLGAHMVGAEVTELIQGYVIAKTGELTDQELSHTIFPHPTLSEMMHEAVLAADGMALHI